MRWLVLMAVTLATADASAAQQFSDRYEECLKGRSDQAAITQCSTAEARAAEAELNAKYAKALNLAASDSPEAQSKIRTAQSAWNSYVNAFIEATYPLENKQVEYGTSYVAAVAVLRVELARSQFPVVDGLIARYTPRR